MQHFLKRAERSTSTSSSASSSSSSTASSDALPIPFDTALGNNFTTSSCPAFFKSFLSNDTFNECVPLSLLLQTSTSFFSIQRSPVRLAQTLGASCSVNFDSCNTLMASLARQIQSPNNCAADLQNQNPTVMQAYTGFIAYQSLYHAGCLLNSNTGSYCFSDAVTNASSPTDSYVYYLPLGISLPSTTTPSCSSCLRDTMSVFASAATNRSQPLSMVYGTAAAMIDLTCGADFVNASIPTVPSTGAASSVQSGLGLVGIIAVLLSLVAVLS
ncbi:hypothetical protein KCU81_g8680, partial [Aureobasidium melanogenum]|uniref:DUF7729 domain-containing protein n=1 Tax=Aureobasidium melanogenum (strain CBS 110374) TaxID=1043003 RepID=A0A074VXE0_AURM1